MTAATASTQLLAATEAIWEIAKKQFKEVAEECMEVSKENYCPVDTGALKESAEIEEVTNSSTQYELELSYNTPYAIYVHEISYYHHPHGQWKYLEVPVNLYRPKFQEILPHKI